MARPFDRLPPLDLLAAFEAAARHLSFTKAASERFVTQSAMSRQIRALEEDLGVPLFRRHHRALTLTDAGAKLHAACHAAFAPLRRTVTELRAPSAREVLALTTTPGLASLWLIPRLPAFTRAHPGIDVRLDTSFAKRNLRADGFDLALRYGPIGAVPGQQLFEETVQPVCSPRLLARDDPPLRQPADLARHTLLQTTESAAPGLPVDWASWLNAVGLPDLQPAASLRFSSLGDAIAAAVDGQGVALGRRPIVDTLLADGRLVTPFDDLTTSVRGYFLIVEPSARSRPAVLALERWLLDEAGASAAGAPSSAAMPPG
jgi:DNA-binding transcriptional LysR family regulator